MPSETARGSHTRSWIGSLKAYLHPRVIAMLFLGFSAGLPFLLIFSTLAVWLREGEVTRTVIGFFSWVGITFSIKVLWAPVVDSLPLPLLARWLGRRRSWMLLAQVAIALGLLALSTLGVDKQIPLIAACAVLIAFASATQDIVIDAYRIEAVEKELQGVMAATYQLGYRLALLWAGAGALYLAEYFSWTDAYRIMAASMLVGIVTVLVIGEPGYRPNVVAKATEEMVGRYVGNALGQQATRNRFVAWFLRSVVSPFVEFFRRNGWMALTILAFICVYRISDITIGLMASTLYVDLGFSKTEIADVTKVFGFFMTIFGIFVGGLLVARLGIMWPLLLGAVLVASTNLLFALLAATGNEIVMLAVAIGADNFSAGLAGTAFIAYLSSLTNSAYTATQYALFSSLFTLPGKLIAGFSGLAVDTVGYVNFFLSVSVLGLPAIVLVLYLMRRANPDRPLAAPATGS